MAHALMIMLAAACVAVPWQLGQRLGLIRLLSPLHLVALFAFGGVLAKTAVFAVWPARAFYQRFDIAPEFAIWGGIYLAGFILCLCLGYVIACAQVQRPPTRTARPALHLPHRLLLVLSALLVSGGVIAVLLASRGDEIGRDALATLSAQKQVHHNEAGVGATFAGLKALFIVPKFAYVALLLVALRHCRRFDWLLVTVLAVALIGVAVASGDRFELLELLFYTAIIWVMAGGKGTIAAPLRFACLGLVAIGVAQIMTAWRGADSLWWQILGSTYFLDINVATMVVAKLSPEHLLWGQSYGWWVFGWVPRAVWIDKPAIDLGVYLKQVVMQVPASGAFNVTGPGEAFINFGWAGMLVALPLGAAMRMAEAWTLQSGTTSARALLYPLLVYPFVQAVLQSSFSAFVVTAVFQLCVLWLLGKLFLVHQRPAGLVLGQTA